MMQMNADALGMDRQASFFVKIGKAHIRLHGQVGLPLQIIVAFHHIGGRLHEGLGVLRLWPASAR